MIGLDEACRIALAFFKDAPENASISSVSEMDDAWVFFFGAGKSTRYGAAAVHVVKESGAASAFAPFFGENGALLDAAKKIEIPMKYRGTDKSDDSE